MQDTAADSGLEGNLSARAIVDDVALVIFADNRCVHPVVEDLDQHSSNGVESLYMTAQQRLQVLVHDIAGEHITRVT